MFCKPNLITISRKEEVGSGGWRRDYRHKKPHTRTMTERKSENFWFLDVSEKLFFLLKETMDQRPRLSSTLMKNDLTFPSILDKGRKSHIVLFENHWNSTYNSKTQIIHFMKRRKMETLKIRAWGDWCCYRKPQHLLSFPRTVHSYHLWWVEMRGKQNKLSKTQGFCNY